MTNTIKWDKPCYKCLSHFCDLSCKETSKTKEQDDEVLGFNGRGFPIEKPNKVMTAQTKAMELALEALELCNGAETADGVVIYTDQEIAAIKEALAQDALQALHDENKSLGLYEPEQEPVAYFNPQVKGGFYWARPTKITAPVTVSVEPMPLYTTPPQEQRSCDMRTWERPWVSLTNDERMEIYSESLTIWSCMEAVEAKLKEKNA